MNGYAPKEKAMNWIGRGGRISLTFIGIRKIKCSSSLACYIFGIFMYTPPWY
jgi:hypothetical protein